MKSTLAIVAFILAAFTLVGSIDYATEAELAAEHYGAAHRVPGDSNNAPQHIARSAP